MEWFDENEATIQISTTNTFKNPKGEINIYFNYLPKNCFECPIQKSFYDEDGFFGNNIRYYCPFGGENWGSAIERPKGCPIKSR